MAAMVQKPNDSIDCFIRRSSLESSDNLDILLTIIKRLPFIKPEERQRKEAEDEFISILVQFKDWPYLLDKKLEAILENCVAIIRKHDTEPDLYHIVFRMIFHVMKIRGYKYVVSMMPHERDDLDLILKLLSNEDPTDRRAWVTAYMLLLWLSQVCGIPYDITQKDESGMKSVLECIVDIGKAYLKKSTMSQEAAAMLLAKFHARLDVVKASLNDLFDWLCEEVTVILNCDLKEEIYLSGILRCLVCLFKYGYRNDLMPHARRVLMLSFQLNYPKIPHVILNHKVKLLRNIGLLFLPRHTASWLYKRKLPNIRLNLVTLPDWKPSIIFQHIEPQVQDIVDVPEEVKEILDHMFKALRTCDCAVRWSTAKGISSLCSFLPSAFVNEVVLSPHGVLGALERGEGYAAQHSGCLTVAECARLGVLQPARFGDMLPVMLQALRYEEPTCESFAGNNVRNAAAYVCWCLARYYDPIELCDHVTTITNSLILVALFDREVTVRRAASAAFQECIGRQGHFPHGIEILTCLDFLGVSNRQTCFIEHSAFIAQFPDYPILMTDCLIESKIVYRNPSMRELATKALNRLTTFCPDYMLKEAFPRILTICKGPDLSAKHGAILALSEIILASNRPDRFTEDDKEKLMRITFELQEKDVFDGMAGNLMRKACFLLIENSSKVGIPFFKLYRGNDLFENWYGLMVESLMRHEESVQEAACSALAAFLTTYEKTWRLELHDAECFVTKYTDRAEICLTAAGTEAERKGFCRATGALPAFVLQDPQRVQRLTAAVIACTQSSPRTLKWADSRRLAVQALASIAAKTIAVIPEKLVLNMGDAMLFVMEYRPNNTNNDIGSVVREASMMCFAELCDVVMRSQRDRLEEAFFTKQRVEQFVTKVVLHAQERIDRSRKVASNVFVSLLHGREKVIPNFPHLENVRAVFTKEKCEGITWYRSEETFSLFCQLLELPFYRRPLLLGLIVSSTATSDLTVRHVTEALQEFLARLHRCSDREGATNALEGIMSTFVDIYEQNDLDERMVLPAMKFLILLLTKTCIGESLHSTDAAFLKKLLQVTESKVYESCNVFKNMAALEIYCLMLQFPLIRKPALSALMTALCHPLPVIRKTAAIEMTDSLITYKGIMDDNTVKETLLILRNTVWESSLDTIRTDRDNLCEILGVSLPEQDAEIRDENKSTL